MLADNDIKGWVMSAVSGAACVLGSALVCLDLILRRFSPLKNFQIANSNGFLSASLCLSAGVMLYTSLYSMLPTSKEYLTRTGLSARSAAFTLIGLFLAGVVVIRIISGLIHHYIPSHVVDCDHTHEQDPHPESGDAHTHRHHHHHHHHHPEPGSHDKNKMTNGSTEHTPLLGEGDGRKFKSMPLLEHGKVDGQPTGQVRRGPFGFRLTRSINLLMGDVKPMCDEDGSCFGFSQACGYECTKTLAPKMTLDKDSRSLFPHHQHIPVQFSMGRPVDEEAAIPQAVHHLSTEARPHPLRTVSEGGQPGRFEIGHPASPQEANTRSSASSSSSSQTDLNDYRCKMTDDESDSDTHEHPSGGQHHHHVPQNAFLSIGLQTVLAIALHKLPEGFITYATNHANPTLGMTVFLALCIHNISEGFAMALPLYLALSSRWKAIVWSSLLGGISQPAGAGLAALWVWWSQKAGGHEDSPTGPSWGIYGGMFAATAGVMTSVALQLLSEGLALTHNRSLGIGFAIAGMGLMGISFALTA